MKNLPQSRFLAGKITKSVRIETIITKTKIQAKIFGTFRATDSRYLDNTYKYFQKNVNKKLSFENNFINEW